MPKTEVFFYCEKGGASPIVEWLENLRKADSIAYAKCVARIERLGEHGHELRRPEADSLRDGVHELRARRGRVHYRLLYGFQGRNVAVLLHGLSKEGEVPEKDIDRAIERRARFERASSEHTYRE